MSEPIKVGDLVMIVKLLPCCGKGKLGFVFTARWVGNNGKLSCCTICGGLHQAQMTVIGDDDNQHVLMARLIKIDPPALDETTDTRESLTA